MRCKQELCPNWSGDGNVCPCAVLDLTPPEDEYDESAWMTMSAEPEE